MGVLCNVASSSCQFRAIAYKPIVGIDTYNTYNPQVGMAKSSKCTQNPTGYRLQTMNKVADPSTLQKIPPKTIPAELQETKKKYVS